MHTYDNDEAFIMVLQLKTTELSDFFGKIKEFFQI